MSSAEFDSPECVFPPALRPGTGSIAIFNPSAATASRFPARLEAGARRLASEFGTDVMLAAQRRGVGYRAGSPADLARELEDLYANPLVDLIVCSIGGFNSNALLDHIDWDILRRNPTILCGYSDATALLVAVHAMTNQVTLHGPALLPQWGDPKGPMEDSIRSLRQCLDDRREAWVPIANEFWASPRTRWEDEHASMHENLRHPAQVSVLREGRGEGRLMGGNVETLNMLLGTPYAPRFDGQILFLESTAEEAYLPRFHRALVHLRHAGVFDKIQGLIIGRCPDAEPVDGVCLSDIVLEVVEGAAFPILVDADIGHTEPIATLPIGCRAIIDTNAPGSRLVVIEPAVRKAKSSVQTKWR